MHLESLILDLRHALRGIRRSPLFATSVAATIGLGLGVLCSAFTIVNAYVLTPVNLPDARALYGLSWDTETVRRQRFRLADFAAASESSQSLFALSAGLETVVMQEGVALQGVLVTGNFFQVIGAQPVLGRTLTPADATAPGGVAVAVLAEYAWRSRYGADPDIVGKRIPLGRQQFEVVGVIRRGMELPGLQSAGFFAPLTMARVRGGRSRSDSESASLFVVGRLREGTTESQARAWFDVWVRQRFPAGSEREPVTRPRGGAFHGLSPDWSDADDVWADRLGVWPGAPCRVCERHQSDAGARVRPTARDRRASPLAPTVVVSCASS